MEVNIEGLTGCRWLTPVILATKEAEIRRIMLKLAQASSSERPYLKKHFTKKKKKKKKRAGGVAQGEGPEFKPQYCKKKKKMFGGHVAKNNLNPYVYRTNMIRTY
jgi:DNA repair photolyase